MQPCNHLFGLCTEDMERNQNLSYMQGHFNHCARSYSLMIAVTQRQEDWETHKSVIYKAIGMLYPHCIWYHCPWEVQGTNFYTDKQGQSKPRSWYCSHCNSFGTYLNVPHATMFAYNIHRCAIKERFMKQMQVPRWTSLFQFHIFTRGFLVNKEGWKIMYFPGLQFESYLS